LQFARTSSKITKSTRISDCIDRSLKKLGEGPAQIIYVTAGRSFGVGKDEIAAKPEQFEAAINRILGAGGFILQRTIVKEIVREFGLDAEPSNLRLHEVIKEIIGKEKFDHDLSQFHQKTWKPNSDVVAKPSAKSDKMKYRGKDEIVNSILRSIKTGATKTKIMYRAYLSYAQLKEYLTLLQDRHFISFDGETELYHVSEKGMRFMNAYDKISESVSSPAETVNKSNVHF
jgi:predicted transcriptional regulator